MSFEKLSIIVDGALGLLGAEVARLGVAAAQDVHGVVGAEQSTSSHEVYSEEPWTQGVDWLAFHTSSGSSLGAWGEAHSPLVEHAHALVLAQVDVDPHTWITHLEHTIAWLSSLSLQHRATPLALVIACNPLQREHAARQLDALMRDPGYSSWLRVVVACVPSALYSPGYRELDEALASVADPSDASLPHDAPPEAMRVELAAMALLRLAMEDDRVGFFDTAQIAHIGDAMMLQ